MLGFLYFLLCFCILFLYLVCERNRFARIFWIISMIFKIFQNI